MIRFWQSHRQAQAIFFATSEEPVFVKPGRRGGEAPGRVQQTHRAPDRDRPLSAVAAPAVICQTPVPGRMALSDFTDGEEDQRASQWKNRPMHERGLAIAGAPFRTDPSNSS